MWSLDVFAIGADDVAHRTTKTYCGGGHESACGASDRGVHLYVWDRGGLPAIQAHYPHRRIIECKNCKGESRTMEEQLTFEEALSSLKLGRKIERSGWNGKGMFIVLQKGYPDGIPINKNTAEATGIAEGTVCRFLPYIMMKTADGAFVPWLASQTDILAEDWKVIR